MAGFICKCGQRLSNNLIPNDIQLWVYTDKEWDKITSQEIINVFDIPSPQYDVWRCTKCERIYFFKNGKLVKSYVLENN